ncbi:hypothetical protein D3C85_1902010 [compost metagenome]
MQVMLGGSFLCDDVKQRRQAVGLGPFVLQEADVLQVVVRVVDGHVQDHACVQLQQVLDRIG